MKKLSLSYLILIVVLGSVTITTVLADTVTISTYPYTIQDGSSNQRLVITSSGNVGIGTSSPSSTLDVAQTSANSMIRLETTTSGSSMLDFLNNGNQEYQLVANRTSNHLEFWRPGVSTSPMISMDPGSGNVGIGTSTPAQKLDITGNIRLTGNIVSPNDICIGSC